MLTIIYIIDPDLVNLLIYIWYIVETLQSILLISYCTTSTKYIYIFFPNPSPHCVTSIIFFQSFPSFIFCLFFFQLFSSLFGSSSHYSILYRYISSNLSSPFLTLLFPIFFPVNLILLPLNISLLFSPCSSKKKKVITILLSFNRFFFFLNYFLQLCS